MDIALKLLSVVPQLQGLTSMSRSLGDYISLEVLYSPFGQSLNHMLVHFLRQSSMQGKAFLKV